ncbi:hypothetical protein F4680DRAFT_307331 [Xylaria scruposa]|nr:hypothetical protein F4680DRAFT_307331 [Xylaria scruposa]
MSGLEVAGLVLGTLPIAVKALQAYREIFHSIKNVSRDLRYIELDLRTEELRLQNTCETLLVGIVPPMQIHSMIEDPFGPGWKSYTEKLLISFSQRLRLYTSYEVFEDHITRMLEATQELRLQLGIEEGSQINLRDSASILRAFKRNASFTLKRKEYESILSKIKAGNAAIQDLPGVRHDLEPDRRRRSQSRLTKLLRSLFQSLYNALHRAITCACAHSHSLGLQLSHRDAVILPNDSEEMTAQSFDFHVTLTASNEHRFRQIIQTFNEAQLKADLKVFQLRLMRDDELRLTPTTTPLLASATPSPKLRVRWASLFDSLPHMPGPPLSTTQTMTQTTTPQTTTKTTKVPPPIVSDLCGIAHGGPGATGTKCYGYVLDAQRKFILSHPDGDNGPQKRITLRQFVERNDLSLPLFGFEDKLQVALALSASVLYLDGTSWLSQIMTLDDIVFISGSENVVTQKQCSRYQLFIVKSISNTLTNQGATPPVTPSTLTEQILGVARHVNPAALSLGALLIQIMIGRVDSELDMTENMDIRSIVSKRERGSQLKEEVLVNGGMNYAAAVNWCLDSIYGVAGLQNDTFCQQFYEAVVARLEDDLKMIASDV